MKRHLSLLLLLLVSTLVLRAQRPQLQLHADLGGYRTFVNYDDAYANLYRKNHLSAAVGASLKLRFGYAVAFEPEVALGGYGLQFYYRNARKVYDIDSHALLGFVSASPMLAVYPDPKFSISAGFSVMVSTFTAGSFVLHRFYNGLETFDFKGHLGDIRNPVVWGPRFMLKYAFENKAGRALGFRLGSFLDMNPIFQQELATPLNPKFVQVFAGFSYAPVRKSR